MRKKFLLLTGLFVAAIIGATFNFGVPHASATVPGTNTLVSINATGTAPASAGTGDTLISRNGRFVMFNSTSSDLVASDTNGVQDVFIRDLKAGTTTRASVSSTGSEGNSDSYREAISETGRYVLFMSKATNLVATTVSGTYYQAYLRDTTTNTTTLLSQTAGGTIANNDSGGLSISEDGRFVLISSKATNLGVTVPINGNSNLYMLDRDNGSFTLLNYKYDGTIPTSHGLGGQMSCDGSLVVISSSAALTSSTSGHNDIYLLDRRAGNKLTDITPTINADTTVPDVSCNGNYVTFSSTATNLDTFFTSNPSSLSYTYAYDRINGTFQFVNKTSSGTVPNSYVSPYSAVSDTGIIAFTSDATNMGGGSNGYSQVYIRDLNNNTTDLLSKNSAGVLGDNQSYLVSISSDGRIANYKTHASNLAFAVSDYNNVYDSYTSLTGF